MATAYVLLTCYILILLVTSFGVPAYGPKFVNMKAEFESRGNQFIAFYEYFQMIRFDLITTDSSIYPANECVFTFY